MIIEFEGIPCLLLEEKAGADAFGLYRYAKIIYKNEITIAMFYFDDNNVKHYMPSWCSVKRFEGFPVNENNKLSK